LGERYHIARTAQWFDLIVIAIGFAASAYYFWKLYGPAVVRAGAE
jgi:hypothetical protein